MPVVMLNNGVTVPQLGFGLGNGLGEEDMLTCVAAALEVGYRRFDTATRYRNEHGLGLALERSGIARDELFVTTKVWNTEHGRGPTLRAFDASLDQLGLEYVDLYLIHYPVPSMGRYVETWLALEEVYKSGRARAIGVANFGPRYLLEIVAAGSVIPAVNQIELHPRYQRKDLRAIHDAHGIATEAWSPLARRLMLDEPLLAPMAERRQATPAQVILRWHLQLGNLVIPRSTTPARMQENFDAITLEPLDEQELAAMDSLDCGARTGPDADLYYNEPVDWSESVARWNELTAGG